MALQAFDGDGTRVNLEPNAENPDPGAAIELLLPGGVTVAVWSDGTMQVKTPDGLTETSATDLAEHVGYIGKQDSDSEY